MDENEIETGDDNAGNPDSTGADGADSQAGAGGEGGEGGNAAAGQSTLEQLNAFLDGDDKGGSDGAADKSGAQGKAQGEGAASGKEGAGGEGKEGAPGKAAAGPAKSAEGDGKGGKDGKGGETDDDPYKEPPGLTQKASAHFQKLVERNKAADDKVKALTAERDDLVGMIAETGVTAEQFGRNLETLKLMNSRVPDERKKALAMLREDVNRLAAEVGEDIGDPDLLKRHPDLAERVQSGDLEAKDARELALARDQQKHRQEQDRKTAAQTEQQAKMKRETDAGLASLDRLEAELKAKDTDYARKRAVIVPAVKGVIARAAKAGTPIHPSQWAGIFRDAYDALKLPQEQKPNANGSGGEQPLRGRQPAGSGQRKGMSGIDVVNAALDEMEAGTA